MNIKLFLERYYRAVRLPICLFREKELLHMFSPQNFNLPLILVTTLPESLPELWCSSTPETMLFGGLYLKETNEMLFLGPVLPLECSLRQADAILSRIGRSSKDRELLIKYFSSTIRSDIPILHENLQFLDFILNGESDRPVTSVSFRWEKLLLTQEFSPVYTEPQNNWIENSLLSYVKYGQLEELNTFLNDHVLRTQNLLPLAEGPERLKMMRNYILGANMLVAHIAMSSGLEQTYCLQLVSDFIQTIQNACTETDLAHIFVRLMREYTIQVRDLIRLPSRSPLVLQINSYIRAHIYQKTTPTNIAASLQKNCSYLCSCFKKETGKTISSYIQECKIQEAKRLLEFGSQSVVEIGEMLNFSSPSYFCSIFRKWEGMTPSEFRKKSQQDGARSVLFHTKHNTAPTSKDNMSVNGAV